MSTFIPTSIVILVLLAILLIVILLKTAKVVPNQQAYVVERLGKFRTVLYAGFHLLIPFLDVVAYKRSLKEQVLDVPKQTCITRDNVSVDIDGVLYLQVIAPEKSAYGISDYLFGAVQLAQTALRSAIGKLELDKTFEERSTINQEVVAALDAATSPWGIKVLRYEIRDITPPATVMQAMEKQMRAERERREAILQAEGQKQSQILVAEGEKQSAILKADAAKQAAILQAEGAKQAKILEAEAEAQAILKVQQATADAIKLINEAAPGDGVIKIKALEAFQAAANGKATKIIIPSEIQGLAGLAAAGKTVFSTEEPKAE